MGNIVFDIETNVPDDKAFEDLGQLAIDTVLIVGFATSSVQSVMSETSFKLFVESPCEEETVFIGHNIIRFDIPVLKRISDIDIYKYGEVKDTLIMSKILYPERQSHSLESWAKDLLGKTKPSLDDLRMRVEFDVIATEKLYHRLESERIRRGIPEHVFKLEYEVAKVIAEQHEHGVYFDKYKAVSLDNFFDTEMKVIDFAVECLNIKVPIPESQLKYPPKVQFKKDGSLSAAMMKYLSNYPVVIWRSPEGKTVVEGTSKSYTLPLAEPLETEQTLKMGSIQLVKDYLMSEGWKPTIWNTKKNSDGSEIKTSPKIYDAAKNICPNLEAMRTPLAKYVTQYYSLRNKRAILNNAGGGGWINNVRVKNESRICADADTLGAITGRFTHRIVANVPRVTSPYGKEMRSLFRATPGYKMVGWDASALEACMEAHFTYPIDNGKYAKELLEGDIHQKNADMLGITRDLAKTFKYAITYGAGVQKLATILGVKFTIADNVRQAFWDGNASLHALRDQLAKQLLGKSSITTIDGREVSCDNAYQSLNRLFQSAGAIVMKYAMVIANRRIKKEGLDAHGLIRYHDEEQWEAREDVAERVGQIGIDSIRQAGLYLKLNVPLKGEYKIGETWADTH